LISSFHINNKKIETYSLTESVNDHVKLHSFTVLSQQAGLGIAVDLYLPVKFWKALCRDC